MEYQQTIYQEVLLAYKQLLAIIQAIKICRIEY